MPPSEEGGGKIEDFDGGRENGGVNPEPVDSQNRPYASLSRHMVSSPREPDSGLFQQSEAPPRVLLFCYKVNGFARRDEAGDGGAKSGAARRLPPGRSFFLRTLGYGGLYRRLLGIDHL